MNKNGMWGSLSALLKKDSARRVLIVVGLCGIALLYLSTLWDRPAKVESSPQEGTRSAQAVEESLEQSLQRIVTAITGEENAAVMVTLENMGSTQYASDGKSSRDENGEQEEKSHVVMKDSDGGQHGLEVTQQQPKVKGVVIVSKYAQDPGVREKLTQAAKVALDISSARVCVTSTEK